MEAEAAEAQTDNSNCEQFESSSDDPPRKKGKKGEKTVVSKGTDEYVKKRARNNEAVRKSRVKSKKRIEETQQRVDTLTQENSDLKTKVTLLSKELNVLRSLFSNGGIALPENVEKTLEVKSEPRDERE